jgi:hypothetical protein
MDAAKITAFLCGNTRQVFKKSASSDFDQSKAHSKLFSGL